MPFLPRRVATAADSAAKPVPNRTTVTGSGIVTGPPGTGVTVAIGVVVAVAEATAPVGVDVGPERDSRLQAMRTVELEDLRAQLKRDRRWD